MQNNFNTPVLFLIFNRLETTELVFNEIKKIKPKKLYIVADGPRLNKNNEESLCKETRDIVEKIDWQCEVYKNYSDINLGCRKRVSSGIDWFFENEEQGIILEDDCLPDQTFFKFCEEMLEKYKNDERVGMVSGNNFQFGEINNPHSYYFSRYSHIWGWATWRRAWRKYDVNISDWPQVKKSKKLKEIFSNLKTRLYWIYVFNKVYKNQIDTWDYQWTYAFFMNNFLSVMPSTNLVSNIGFSDSSTHTKRKSKFSRMKITPLDFPLKHPQEIVPNVESDRMVQKNNYPFWRYFIGTFIKKFLK